MKCNFIFIAEFFFCRTVPVAWLNGLFGTGSVKEWLVNIHGLVKNDLTNSGWNDNP